MSKVDEYVALVTDRKKCRLCEEHGLRNPFLLDPVLDSDEIGPWSRWQGNLDAVLMIVGQDWGDDKYYLRNGGLEAANNPTNVFLRELIGLAGLAITAPDDPGRESNLFFTNAVLCLKRQGGLQGPVALECFANCAAYLKRQIEIVAPRVLVCLGERAYRGVTSQYGLATGRFRNEVESESGHMLANGTRVFARYHCGKRILNTHRKPDQQRDDWQRLARFVADQ